MIAYQAKEKVFFIFGFAKNECENLDSNELIAIKEYAKELLGCTEQQLKQLTENGTLIEMRDK